MQRAGLAPPGYGERTLAVVTLFLLAFGVPTVWFQADNTDVPTGDSIVIIVNSVLFALAFTRLVGSWRHVGRAIRREPFLLMFVAFMVFSTVWSTTPDATFRRSTAIFLTTFFGYYLVVRFPLREIIRLTALALMIGTVVQFVWVLVLRKYGVTQITGELAESGDWSGVYPHKNALGRGSLLAAVLFVFAARTFPRRRVLYWAFFALNTVLIVGSNSKTALVALVLLVVLMALFTGLRAHATLYGGVAFGLVGTAVLAAGFVTTNLGPISESLGKDATLTGRTQLWTDVIHEIGRRPWLGFGWLGFWTGDPTGPSGYVLARNLWHPPNAHNAVLELLINLGIIGAALFLVVYFRGLFRSVGQVRRVPTILGLFPLTYFSLVLLESITEIGVIGRDLTWALFVVAVVLAGRDRAEPVLGAPAARATATRPPRQARTATGRPVAAAVVDAPVLEDPALEDPALEALPSQTPPSTRSTTTHRSPSPSPPPPNRHASPAPAAPDRASRSDVLRPELRDLMPLRKRASRRRPDASDLFRGDHGVTTFAHPHTRAVPVTLRGRLLGAARTKMFRDTGWTMIAEMAGMASQLVTLVLIARVFSQETYGIFAGTVGLMNVISPFTTIGMGYVLVQRVAGENEDPDVESGRAWTTISIGGLVGIVFVLATSWLLIPDTSVHVIVALGLGELIFTQITYAGRFCAQALDRPATGARVTSMVWGFRLVAAILFLAATPSHSLGAWSVFHMTASFVGAVFTIVVLSRTLMLSPRPSLARARDVRQGMAYSLTIGATYLKNDADKTLLLSFGKTDAAGLYALGYRVITPLYVPVRALADSTFARFFREGSHSAAETYALARRTTMIGGAFTLVGGAIVALCAPLLPVLVGDKWDDAVIVTQLLAFVPFLVAMQMYAFNALIGLGKRTTCLAVTVGTSLLNLSLNLLLIPRYTWRGSTAATFIAEGASVVALWALLRREVTEVAPTRDHLRSI